MARVKTTPAQERITDHAAPEQMLFTKLGDPLPRQLPDGRMVIRSDLITTLDDQEAMEWLDGIEQYTPEDAT